MELRFRDILAAIALLWLSSSAWNEESTNGSIGASIRLAFYLPNPMKGKQKDVTEDATIAKPAILDVDGDGTPEALALWTTTNTNDDQWKIQILDLRPLVNKKSITQSSPFQPKILLESDIIDSVQAMNRTDINKNTKLLPLQITTGHVLTSEADLTKARRRESKSSSSSSGGGGSSNDADSDRTIQYFCGKDWHDAAERCAVHCPSGQSTDCPDQERCYADTGCSATIDNSKSITEDESDSSASANHIYNKFFWNDVSSIHTTPAGSWPSLFTVWAPGVVTMHSLTTPEEDDQQQIMVGMKKRKPKLHMKLMWHAQPFKSVSEWYNIGITFVDAVSSGSIGSKTGMVVITATASVLQSNKYEDDDTSYEDTQITIALDALTGEMIWQSVQLDKTEEDGDRPLLFPALRGHLSTARRRSLIPDLNKIEQANLREKKQGGPESTVNCLREYRRSLLTSSALPYQMWDEEIETTVRALHFEHQSGKAKSAKVQSSKKNKSKNTVTKQKKRTLLQKLTRRKKHHNKEQVHYGKPNVIVTHNTQGIQVRALKNGRSLCHLSLQPRTLYADINHDGNLDSLQVITNNVRSSLLETGDDDIALQERKWVEDFARRVSDVNRKSEELSDRKARLEQSVGSRSKLCHMLALSGIPSKEELFSVNLCSHSNRNGKHIDTAMDAAAHQIEIEGAPVLLVEPSSRTGRGYDIMTAVNTGIISRFRGNTGRRVWQVNGRLLYGTDNFPSWDDGSIVIFNRIESDNVIPATRPVILTGENAAIILASSSGNVLSSTTFPQPARTRPMLIDFDGDGTTDLLVTTTDAIWGYHVTVRTGASASFRIMVGLLVMGLMLAFLRNRFGPHPGKRSTDL